MNKASLYIYWISEMFKEVEHPNKKTSNFVFKLLYKNGVFGRKNISLPLITPEGDYNIG